MFCKNKKVALIPNARYWVNGYSIKAKQSTQKNIDELENIWLEAEILDLKDFF